MQTVRLLYFGRLCFGYKQLPLTALQRVGCPGPVETIINETRVARAFRPCRINQPLS